MKSELYIALIALALLSGGCIEKSYSNTQDAYDLQYDLNNGDVFFYNVLATIEKPSTEVSEETSIHVAEIKNDNINLKVSVDSTVGNALSKEDYSLNMTSRGTINDVNSNNLIIPEIQPELVSILEFPDKQITEGDVWYSYFNKNASQVVDGNLFEYSIIGNTTYKCIGFENILVTAGKFDCATIETNTTYILDISSVSNNKTVSLKTVGNTFGEKWIDLNKGVLIKSEYYVDKNVQSNYSDVYKDIGIKNAYREIPMKSYIVTELLSVNGD
ncbi:hypothetical protein V7O61_03315 [Methanolobus sp. WCC1]|uniref:hypothetical protein n=1 Tax=unclassified Methanolobus TaxID=2629569 RepID=UPI0032478AB0